MWAQQEQGNQKFTILTSNHPHRIFSATLLTCLCKRIATSLHISDTPAIGVESVSFLNTTPSAYELLQFLWPKLAYKIEHDLINDNRNSKKWPRSRGPRHCSDFKMVCGKIFGPIMYGKSMSRSRRAQCYRKNKLCGACTICLMIECWAATTNDDLLWK